MSIEKLVGMKKDYEKMVETQGKQILKDEFAAYFKEFPGVRRVAWTQYTPYFNDGDECVFRVNSDAELDLGGTEEDEDAQAGEGFETVPWSLDDNDPKRVPFDAASKMIDSIPKDVLKCVFGDHCTVIASRDGFEVESYDHD